MLWGCPKKGGGSDLTGTWKDVTVDKITRITPEKREEMRMRIILSADGTGKTVVGGRTDSLHWIEKGGTIEVTADKAPQVGPRTLPFKLSADRRKMNFAGAMELIKE